MKWDLTIVFTFRSKCRHLGYNKGNLAIVDTGLDRVFVISQEDATVFGEAGDQPGEFNNPAEVALDDSGNSIIVDTKNNRLQLVDVNQNAYPVKVRLSSQFDGVTYSSALLITSYLRSTINW